jgi:dolichol kinase
MNTIQINKNNELDEIEFEKKKKKKKKKKNIPYEQEVMRKGIHLLSLLIPIVYVFTPKSTALIILFLMAFVMVMTDILSKKETIFKEFINRYFSKMLRQHEKHKKKIVLNGASWVLISAFFTVLLFPKIIAITAFTILIISDISAALIGRKYGRNRLLNKSWEGTFAFFISALLVILVIGLLFSMPYPFFVAGIIASFLGAFAEAISDTLRLDDNISVPITVGSTFMALFYLFDLFKLPYHTIL